MANAKILNLWSIIKFMIGKKHLQNEELIKRNFAPIFQEQGVYIYGSNVFVSVTKVMLSPDISQAKVYLSIYNTDDREKVLQKIISHTHMLKQHLAQRIRNHIRRIPQIYFHFDETIDEMYKVDEMFARLNSLYPKSSEEE